MNKREGIIINAIGIILWIILFFTIVPNKLIVNNKIILIGFVYTIFILYVNIKLIGDKKFGNNNEASNLMAKLTDPNTDFDKPQTEKARAFVRRLANAWIAADESHRQGGLTDNTYELLRDDVQMVLLTYPSIQPFVNEFLGFYPTSRGLLGYAGEVLKEANPL